MSATLVSSNTTIKVNGNVSATGTAFGGTVTLYTAPANGYAIIQAYCTSVTGGVSGFLSVSGRAAVNAVSGTGAQALYVGPTASVTVTSSGAGNVVFVIAGVEFLNTP